MSRQTADPTYFFALKEQKNGLLKLVKVRILFFKKYGCPSVRRTG